MKVATDSVKIEKKLKEKGLDVLVNKYENAKFYVFTNKKLLSGKLRHLNYHSICEINNKIVFLIKEEDDIEELVKIIKNWNNFLLVHVSTDSFYNVVKFMRYKDIKIAIKILDFVNYCYVSKDLFDEMSSEEGIEGRLGYKTLFGQDVVKVRSRDFHMYKKSRDVNMNEVFEADIDSSSRYLIDNVNNINIDNNPRVCTFDIETHGSVDVVNTPKPIISISLYDNYTDKYYVYLYHPSIDNKKYTKDNVVFVYYRDEKKMLDDFVKMFKRFDIITGWNIKSFDLLYVYNRYIKLGGDANKLSPVRKVKYKIFKDEDRFQDKNFRIYGIDCMDALTLTRTLLRFNVEKPTSMDLSTVSKFVLGKQYYKKEISESPSKLWINKKFDELLEYNLQDVKLVVLIAKKLKIWEYYSTIRSVVKAINYEDTTKNSIIIDRIILTKYKDVVFPTKKWETKLDDFLTGAYVMKPKRGIRKNVAVLDFSAMYPNIIRTLNISIDTIDEQGDVKINKVDKDGNFTNEGYYKFNSKKKGIMSELENELITQRYKYKSKMKEAVDDAEREVYDTMQTAFKAIVNSTYGVYALPSFRLYNMNIANAITSAGRALIHSVIEFINNNTEFEVLYADTDSCFVYKEGSTKEDYENLENLVNSKLFSIVKQLFNVEDKDKNIRMEFETLFDTLILSDAKKKYIGLTKYYKGKNLNKQSIKTRGTQMIRRDCPDAIKKLLEDLILFILQDHTDEEIRNKIRATKTLIYSLDKNDLIVKKQINKKFDEYIVKPQHVRAAIYSNEYLDTQVDKENYNFGILFVKVNSKYPKTDCIAVSVDTELPKQIIIDYEKYFKLYIENKINLLVQDNPWFGNKSLKEYIKK